MTPTDLRRIAARVSVVRTQVELAALCERDTKHRRALDRLRDVLLDGERGVLAEVDGAQAEATT